MGLGCIFRVLWSGMGTRGMSLGVCYDWCNYGQLELRLRASLLFQVLLFQMQASKVT